MLLYVVCLAAALSSSYGDPPLPKWPKVYTVKLDYYIPAEDYHSTSTVWYDGIQNKTRIDNHLSSWQFYTAANATDMKKSLAIIVQPMTTETYLNMRVCAIHHRPYWDWNIFPEMFRYDYVGNERTHGEDAFKYQIKAHNNNTSVEYTIWVALKQGVYTPLKQETKLLDTLHGTLLRHEYTDYYDFDTSDIDPDNWDLGCGATSNAHETSSILEGVMADQTMKFLLPLQNHEELKPIHNEFDQFKIQFNKQYENGDEHDKRLKIYEDNVRFINEHNKAGHSYKLKVNHLADRTEEELVMMFRNPPRSAPSKALPFPYTAEEVERLSQDLPTEFDWRPYGAVTPVKNQQDCAAGWAFSAVGAVEGALFLRNGSEQLVRLSEQAVLDCSWGFGSYGCYGGTTDEAFKWMQIHGLPTDVAYGGYIRSTGLCLINNVTKVATVKDYYQVTAGDEKALQVALINHGPIAVAIAEKVPEFLFYSHGVFYDPYCGNDKHALNHFVLLVGYGVLDGEKYWLVKNNFGTGWGTDGYMLISTKDNICGVETEAFYVELE